MKQKLCFPLTRNELWLVRAVGVCGWLALLSICVGCLLNAGCSTLVANQAEVGLRYGTEITLFSRAAQTSPEPASSTLTIDLSAFRGDGEEAPPATEP